MCLNIKRIENLRKADKDIPVYKIIEKKSFVDFFSNELVNGYCTPYLKERLYFVDGICVQEQEYFDGKIYSPFLKTNLNEFQVRLTSKPFVSVDAYPNENYICYELEPKVKKYIKNQISKECLGLRMTLTFNINKGIHSVEKLHRAIRLKRSMLYLHLIICEAYIPKGSYYYVGKKGDIVSNRLVIKEPKDIV